MQHTNLAQTRGQMDIEFADAAAALFPIADIGRLVDLVAFGPKADISADLRDVLYTQAQTFESGLF
jgi:hypothetical protein